MPRYFFDLTIEDPIPDTDGIDLVDETAALSQAVMILGGTIIPKSEAKSLLGEHLKIECRGERGELLFVLEYSPAQS